MQRRVPEGIIISCDFCGTDWDQETAMIEGHHGSVLCLECFKTAYVEAAAPASDAPASVGPTSAAGRDFCCSLCLRTLGGDVPHWRHAPMASPPPGFNPEAVVCGDCLKQAAGAFHKDPDVPWSRPAK
jgi:hypothetical protein